MAPQSGYLLQGLKIFYDNYLHYIQDAAVRLRVLQLYITYELMCQFNWARKIKYSVLRTECWSLDCQAKLIKIQTERNRLNDCM